MVIKMCKQYWADAATKNCVWLFQTKQKRFSENGCHCDAYTEEGDLKEDRKCSCGFEYWRTENVFLTKDEALAHGKSRPHAWGEFDEGWRIWGVMCMGLMAEILGKHNKEFEDKVEYIS